MIKTILRGKDYLTGKMLRLLGRNGGFVEPTNGQEEIIHANILGNNYHSRMEIEAAWLEAERNKSKAVMELQRRHLIY